MKYEEYCTEYEKLLTNMLKYSPDQIGSGLYAEKLADLEEANPEHAQQYDEQFS